jgi:large subunit ribosomal protein L10
MRPEKKSIVGEIRERIEGAEFLIAADYRGLSVEKMTDLRRRLSGARGSAFVVKNSLLGHVADDLGMADIKEHLDGPTLLVSGKDDVVGVVKVLRDFRVENELPAVKGGILGRRGISAADISEIAGLPPREALLGRVVGTIAAPMTMAVGALSRKLSTILYVLKAVEEKKKGA